MQDSVIVIAVLFLLTGVLILFYVAIVTLTAPDPKSINLNNVPFVDTDELIEQTKTGDLLFFSGDSFGEKVIKWYHGSYYTHMGMIIREDNIPYLWEADLGQGYRDGPRVIRLKDKLDRWKGIRIGYWKRLLGISLKPEQILKIVDELVELDMDRSMMSWFFADDPGGILFNYFKPPKTVFCSELIASTLIKLGLLSEIHHPAWYTQQDFLDGVGLLRAVYGVNVLFKF